MLALLLPGSLFAAAGDLYLAEIDEVNPAAGAVIRISPDGTQHPFADSLRDPYGVVFDRDRQVLVSSDLSNSIFRYSLEGAVSTFASGLNGPLGLARDSAGNIYAADIRSSSILKFTPTGTKSTLASGIARPIGVTVDSAGNVYAGGFDSGIITKITPTGTKSTFATGLVRPYALLFDQAGNLLIAERGAGVVSKITPQGARSIFVSGLVSPFGLVFDGFGNLFISDHDDSKIIKLTPAGDRTTFATDVKSPAFMAFEPAGGSPVNISSRLRVRTGNNVLIGGFIVTGNAAKKVAIRAIGPSLAKAGLADALQDPTLELRDNAGAIIAQNDNWKDAQQSELEQASIAPSDDREAAIVATVAPGAYTAIVRGKAETEGVGVVELYDLDQPADAKLANISTRGFVDTGDNVLIGGFIISGDGARVLARAIGPSLVPSGIANALADPTLTLFNGNGVALASNDNWKDTQQVSIQDAMLAPSNDLEPAIVATLPNGLFTAIVRGTGGGTGVAVIEIYSLP